MHPTRLPIVALIAACLVLAGCGEDGPETRRGGVAGEDVLPRPDAAGGSVTGMPDPGEASVEPGVPVEPPAEPIGSPDIDIDIDTASPALPPDMVADSSTESALALLRQYYAAINARDFAGAYALWRDQGRASGQSPEQFANGFAQTDGVSVQFGQPGPVDAGAGQRHIEIPVSVEARQADGSVRRFAGAYILQMTVVDGASTAQRSWHIASAGLREVTP